MSAAPSAPASGAWREGDPAGRRRFADLGDLPLTSGQVLPGVRLAYETWWPPPREAEGVVLVLHALTGDSHVVGVQEPGHPSPGWWPAMVGPGAPLDTDRYAVVAPNVLGGCQGSTGPSSTAGDGAAWGSRFPALTTRDQVEAEARLADHLGVDAWHLVVGGSMGGMRAVEWAVGHPHRVERLLALATCARASADQIAWWSVEQTAVRGDPGWAGGDYHGAPPGAGPARGLGEARRIAHLTYRSAPELETRFGREPQGSEDPLRGGRFAVESYLDHAAAKLVGRFDAGSYVTLSAAMQSHDVGAGRGGVPQALSQVRALTRVVALDSDRLFPQHQSQEIADHVPSAPGIDLVTSPYGHDGFLLEAAAVGGIARELLSAAGSGARLATAPATARRADGPPGPTGASGPRRVRVSRREVAAPGA